MQLMKYFTQIVLNMFIFEVILNIKIENSTTPVSTDSFFLKIQSNNVTLVLNLDNYFYTEQFIIKIIMVIY